MRRQPFAYRRAAERAGIQIGELVRNIDGRACAEMTGSEVARRLWLPAGVSVRLEILGRDGQVGAVTLQ